MKKYDTSVKITYFNVDWLRIKSACMTTISKQAKQMPGQEWRRKLLICEHSPIRRSEISWKWDAIPYAISTHFARHHEGCEKFIGTERTDRTRINREERSQMNYQLNYLWHCCRFNFQSILGWSVPCSTSLVSLV